MKLELSKDEALVLFEWLNQIDDRASAAFRFEAERIVFWNVQAQLEKTLEEPFDQNYLSLVEKARARITG